MNDDDDDFFTGKMFTMTRYDMSINKTWKTVRSHSLEEQVIDLRPKRITLRPGLHETEGETNVNYCETETK